MKREIVCRGCLESWRKTILHEQKTDSGEYLSHACGIAHRDMRCDGCGAVLARGTYCFAVGVYAATQQLQKDWEALYLEVLTWTLIAPVAPRFLRGVGSSRWCVKNGQKIPCARCGDSCETDEAFSLHYKCNGHDGFEEIVCGELCATYRIRDATDQQLREIGQQLTESRRIA